MTRRQKREPGGATTAQEADETAERYVAPPAVATAVETEEQTAEDIVEEGIALGQAIRATGICLTVRVIPGARLPKPLDDYPSGIGTQTLYGIAFILDWRDVQPPFFEGPDQHAARAIMHAIEYEKEERWRITREIRKAIPEDTPPTERPTSERRSGGSPRRGVSRRRPTGTSRRRRT